MNEYQSMLISTIKTASADIEVLRKAVAELGEKLEGLEIRQKQLECQTAKNAECQDGKNIEQHNESPEKEQDNPAEKQPIMQGAGFSHITPEYLKNLRR